MTVLIIITEAITQKDSCKLNYYKHFINVPDIASANNICMYITFYTSYFVIFIKNNRLSVMKRSNLKKKIIFGLYLHSLVIYETLYIFYKPLTIFLFFIFYKAFYKYL